MDVTDHASMTINLQEVQAVLSKTFLFRSSREDVLSHILSTCALRDDNLH